MCCRALSSVSIITLLSLPKVFKFNFCKANHLNHEQKTQVTGSKKYSHTFLTTHPVKCIRDALLKKCIHSSSIISRRKATHWRKKLRSKKDVGKQKPKISKQGRDR